MDPIPTLLLRTTCCTVIAGCTAALLLRHINSPKTHRIAAVMILLQGWAVVPIVVQVPAAIRHTVVPTTQMPPNERTVPSEMIVDYSPVTQPPPSLDRKVSIDAWLVVLWIAGIVTISARGVSHYVSFLRRLPLGDAPTESDWVDDWKFVTEQDNLSSNVRFRITSSIGPLVCFVPFVYLVLAPRRLWASLDSQQRRAILQHELAHVTRLDLWKSLAIRILAMPQWFNPIAWRAVARFDEAAEWSCDDLVMNVPEQAYNTSYPAALLRFAHSQTQNVPYSLGASNGILSTRIRRLVQPRFTEESKMTKSLTLLLLVAIALVQSIRISSTTAEETTIPNAGAYAETGYRVGNADVALFTPEHRENLAVAGLLPYRIDPPDVIAIRLTSENSRGAATSVTADLLVGPEGTIEHKQVGKVSVAGKTADEVKRLIETRLRANGDDRHVTVKIAGHNSKVFYVIREDKNGAHDQINRIPCTTDSNVHSAIESLGLEDAIEDTEMWVSRPIGNGKENRVIPIKWHELSGDMKSPNYFPLLPTDRVFIGDRREPQVVVSADESSTPAPYYAAKHPIIRLSIQIISDEHGNLAEFKELMQENRGMVANTLTTQATLRILEKNNLTSTLGVPSITCHSGQAATVSLGEFEIATVASLTPDAKLRVETRVKMDAHDKTNQVTAMEMAANEMGLMKADDTLYLAITSEVMR